MRRRRESVVTVYKKTTKFLTTNTTNLLKKMPNKKYRLLTKMNEECEDMVEEKNDTIVTSEEDDELGERDLDYYLGVRKKEIFWREPASKEQIRKDFLLYHCGVTEEDYEKKYKISAPKVSSVVQPRLKQVPFKIHRKRKARSMKDDSWRENSLFKLFAYKRESEYSDSSDSYRCPDKGGVRRQALRQLPGTVPRIHPTCLEN
ncbi:putative membrane protein, required for N-linked glycosylation [Operophtera brumata]|uniref:Putative membrane protein, required for N-linked glycosylation n=1 Tax=Operophtera brumata TaxID=104452 RepID=A0A0L7LJ07_OPEBR|nr:putative membrane protein, required for N-linked glycosylation [Operophtera brumata]